ncbi:MAG: type II toxin-antitoxin system RelE/ParE family toxin [Sedimentisphaerales bacterium]|nr:type II toxin-antitoxin system RelE/ParE family toxin [Sedimentisphaerales bacterium]
MKLYWTEPAVADLAAIRDYIRRDSEFYASRFVNRLFDAAESLVELPARGRPVPEADDPDIRELLYQGYRIMYRVEKERVVILAIVHGARDWTHTETRPWDVV